MGERRAKFRVFLLDARGDGQYLRATWHPNGRLFVLSHWQDDVCVAATRLDLADAGELMSLLATGLTDAATAPRSPEPQVAVTPTRRTRWRSVMAWAGTRARFGRTASPSGVAGPEPEPFESTVIPWRAPVAGPPAASGPVGGRAGR